MTGTERASKWTVDERTAPVVLSGADVVSISRIQELLDEFGASFKRRVFTESERSYCDAQPHPSQHYAARWAAKEAFLKTLDHARPPVCLDTIGVERRPSGPTLSLTGDAESVLSEALSARGTSLSDATVSVSLSHDRRADCAFATAVVAADAAVSDGEE
ncbi:holo-ACP synthase (plasmid) [Haloferax sp. S1W]|uniref:holo-ACP synthase n=1 Tax=Haloferax sp. S1W TaxID=3377110 RepID=UPI0037CAC678